jgi:predicted SprT family Zn-dependent metalloprotease
VRLRINIVISTLALITIIWGVRFIVAQERRRTPQYLQGIFQELNKQFFENALPAARFEWADLTGADAMGQTFQESDDSFVIQVDRNSNFWDEDDLRDTVEHETCHVATWGTEQDAHGPIFQACMARIKARSHG